MMRTALAAGACVCASVFLAAQDVSVRAIPDPPPAELADPIEALMQTGGQGVSAGGKTIDLWWVKSLPLKSGSTDKGWPAVEEGTLVGAVKLPEGYADMRGKPIRPGVYTLRYGLQPEDGNHLGVTPNREFLLLGPAAVDNSVSALGHDGTIALAKQSSGAGHPSIWGLDPPSASGPALRTYKNDAGQTGVVFQVPISRDGQDAGVIVFGLILSGTIQS